MRILFNKETFFENTGHYYSIWKSLVVFSPIDTIFPAFCGLDLSWKCGCVDGSIHAFCPCNMYLLFCFWLSDQTDPTQLLQAVFVWVFWCCQCAAPQIAHETGDVGTLLCWKGRAVRAACMLAMFIIYAYVLLMQECCGAVLRGQGPF